MIEAAKQEFAELNKKDDIEDLKSKLNEANKRIEKLEELLKDYLNSKEKKLD